MSSQLSRLGMEMVMLRMGMYCHRECDAFLKFNIRFSFSGQR